MNETKHSHHHQEGPHRGNVHADHIPYWKRAHRDWRFWVGVFFIALALFIYVTSVDLSLVPHRNKQSQSMPVGQ